MPHDMRPDVGLVSHVIVTLILMSLGAARQEVPLPFSRIVITSSLPPSMEVALHSIHITECAMREGDLGMNHIDALSLTSVFMRQ